MTIELTTDDLDNIRHVVSHPGWKALVEKVWEDACRAQDQACRMNAGNGAVAIKHQGIHEGIQKAARVAREIAFPEERPQHKEPRRKRERHEYDGAGSGSAPV